MSTADEKWKVANLLLVELSRRLGRFDEASNRLEQFEKAATKASLKIPADVVQQQRELIKLKDAAAHRVGVVKSCSVCATEAQACSERLPSTEPAGLGVAEALCAANRRSCELDCTGKVD